MKAISLSEWESSVCSGRFERCSRHLGTRSDLGSFDNMSAELHKWYSDSNTHSANLGTEVATDTTLRSLKGGSVFYATVKKGEGGRWDSGAVPASLQVSHDSGLLQSEGRDGTTGERFQHKHCHLSQLQGVVYQQLVLVMACNPQLGSSWNANGL